MPFNLKEFKKHGKSEFATREISVAGSELANFFDDGEKPIFTVQGIGGEGWLEIEQACSEWREAQRAEKEKTLSKYQTEQIRKILDVFGLSTKKHWRILYDIKVLILGVQEPKVDLEIAKILVEKAPNQSKNMIKVIDELSGRGGVKKN